MRFLSILSFTAVVFGVVVFARHQRSADPDFQNGKIFGRFQPTWDSLDQRVAPTWYDKAKVGIFLHWGVFSVPSFKSEWFWWYWQSTKDTDVVNYVNKNYRPGWTYVDFAKDFTAEFYDATQWATLFEKAGAKYVVLTTKHHEGFTMWPSKTSFNWNAMDVGPKRDLVGELEKAVRKTSVHFGVYHSLFEWFNPIWLADKANNFTTQDYSSRKTMPELYDLVNTYKPDVIWSDGDLAPDVYWNSTHFLAWLYNDSPVKDSVLVNDRWGTGTSCKHGDFFNCADRYNPGHVLPHKWEDAFTLDAQSWGYRREMTVNDVLRPEDIMKNIVTSVACNGNVLINVGPRKDGTIAPIFQERLLQMGQWLQYNGEAIYETSPWVRVNDTINKDVWFTTGPDTLYVHVLKWPANSQLEIGAVNSTFALKSVSLLGTNDAVKYNLKTNGMTVNLPALPMDTPLKWAWVLKLTM